MSTTTEEGNLTKKDFVTSNDVRWCPGCGDYAILNAVQRTLPELGIPKEQFGFSNNARGTFGPPSFESASFTLDSYHKLLMEL